MTEKGRENPIETTEVDIDPLITTKLAYVERIKNELGGIKEQIGILQYELDIRVTALALYESSLQMQDDPKKNGKDAKVEYTEKDLGDGLKKGIKKDKTLMEEGNEM